MATSHTVCQSYKALATLLYEPHYTPDQQGCGSLNLKNAVSAGSVQEDGLLVKGASVQAGLGKLPKASVSAARTFLPSR